MDALKSEAWRAECEARYVCKLKTKAERLEYLKGVEQKRGIEGADKLREDVRRLWNEHTDARRA